MLAAIARQSELINQKPRANEEQPTTDDRRLLRDYGHHAFLQVSGIIRVMR